MFPIDTPPIHKKVPWPVEIGRKNNQKDKISKGGIK
jgi:hypothetical protein